MGGWTLKLQWTSGFEKKPTLKQLDNLDESQVKLLAWWMQKTFEIDQKLDSNEIINKFAVLMWDKDNVFDLIPHPQFPGCRRDFRILR